MSKPVRIFIHLFEPNCQQFLGSKISKKRRIEKMLWRMAVLQLFLYITVKGGDIRRVTLKSSGGRL